LATESQRGRPPEVPLADLAWTVRRFLALAEAFCPDPIAEFEVNPLVTSGGRLVALDALLKLSGEGERSAAASLAPPRPLAKIRRLLKPRSIAVVGVSEKLNPGRIILQNILREGFPIDRVTVVKPGVRSIDGCRCVPTLAELPQPTDLVVLSVTAAQSAEMLTEIAEERRAESVVLIPGGLEEKAGKEAIVTRMRQALVASRATEGRGPIVNGGNCLGIRSVPGRYNTLFIPEHKLPIPRGAVDPVALINGSGAFAVSKGSKLAGVNPRYTITFGNQMDLTVADYLQFLKDDPEIELFAVYLEGFRPLDGARFLEAARDIARSGRTVVLYRAGRTRAGAEAAASHTAAVAGDYLITRQLAQAAGCVVADTLDDFEDLVRLFTFLRGSDPAGTRLGALSNAGFECVAIADHLGPFRLAPFAEATEARIAGVLARVRLGDIVSIRNPIDLTPILGDADYEAVTRAILEDPGVDVAVVGCVPMTGAIVTLPAGPGHGDDIRHPDSIVARLLRVRQESRKPWVAVVDAGRLYDPMAQALEDGGIPTFRTADRALRLFGLWCRARLAAGSAAATAREASSGNE
jgi:acyl-CoA synthetase (NDP forming)